MTYEKIFKEVKKAFSKADTKAVTSDFAFQFNITGEGEGIFYAACKNGVLSVEPYDYKDRDVIFTADGDTFIAIANGKTEPIEAIKAGKLYVDGNHELAKQIMFLIAANAAKKPAAKKAAAKPAAKKTAAKPAAKKPAAKPAAKKPASKPAAKKPAAKPAAPAAKPAAPAAKPAAPAAKPAAPAAKPAAPAAKPAAPAAKPAAPAAKPAAPAAKPDDKAKK